MQMQNYIFIFVYITEFSFDTYFDYIVSIASTVNNLIVHE